MSRGLSAPSLISSTSISIVPLVNAWRAQNGLVPISADQFDSNRFNNVDMRVSKSISFGPNRKLELIAQVFNLFGTSNLGDTADTWVRNALSDSFGRLLTARNRNLPRPNRSASPIHQIIHR